MLVSLEWLNELVDISDLKPEDLGEALTMSGLEIEEIEYIKPKFSKVYSAKINEINPHPDASKIRLATVDYGFGTQVVVCGASNIEAGQTIAFGIEGATVYNRKDGTQFELKKVAIRGVESSGMICSASELCLEGPEYEPFKEGVIILSDMARFKNQVVKPGTPLEELLELPVDTVLHTAPTANRGDLMSMRGIANEVSAIFNRPVKMPAVSVEENTLIAKETFTLAINNEDTCKYYALGLVKNIKVKNSPSWMAKRLEASGMRPISNIVDITNYVMLEYGQPLHAFDYKKLPEKSIIVRRANDKEKLTTLDSIERTLSTETVLITTPDRPVALAGVMGGENSEIDDTTIDLAIESAYFTPATTRKSARSVGLRSEASARFERGVDLSTVELALKRTMQLLTELADADTAGIFSTGSCTPDPVIVELRFNQLEKVLGIDIPKDKCIEIMNNLSFKLIEDNGNTATFEVPTYRTVDVYREIDLIEEISRIYGFDKIEERIPKRTHLPVQPAIETLCASIKQILLGKGLTEIVTSSLTGDPLLNWCGISIDEKKVVRVTNPQSDEYTMLRQNMIPSILQVAKYNIDRDIKDIWVFEIGKTYFVEREVTKKDPGTTENLILSGAISGDTQTARWHTKDNVDFYYLKGLIEDLFEQFGLTQRVDYTPATDIDYLHPGRSAYISVKEKKAPGESPYIGFIGQVHPQLNTKCKLGQDIYVFELNLNSLLRSLSNKTPFFKHLPQYPAVYRDVAFLANEAISFNDINKTIKKASTNLLQETEVFDIYKGEHVPDDKKSVAVRLTIQDVNATLTDEVVEAEVEKIREGLKKTLEVTFR